MFIKTIIVQVDRSPHCKERIGVAARLAIDHGAHLIGLGATGWSATVMPAGAIGMGAYPVTIDFEPVRQTYRETLAAFEAEVRALGVASVETRLVDDEAGLALATHGLCSDLIVVSQTRGLETPPLVRTDLPDYLALHGATPVLVIPASGSAERLGDNVALAWNDSPEARRAIVSALPVLCRASRVSLIMIDSDTVGLADGVEPGADMAAYLARHGVAAEIIRHRSSGSADEAIAQAAAQCGADLIVMGAYGRSRFSEMLLGGATRTMLGSMRVPLWMAH